MKLHALRAGASALGLATLIACWTATASAAPIKLVFAGSIGREADLTQVQAKGGPALEDLCTVSSKDECQAARPSSIAGGFSNVESVAGAPDGDVYVADDSNARIQEFEPDGKFVLAFGHEVDATTLGDLCTAASGDTCKAGVAGAAAGQLGRPFSVAVDPVSGNVYVAEEVPHIGYRVQEFTPEGGFVLEIGREVNQTTKGNLCTAVEQAKGVQCGAPAPTGGSDEPGALSFGGFYGNALAAGGEDDLLYVANEHRVQKFSAAGEPKGELPVSTTATAVAVAEPSGEIAVVENEGGIEESRTVRLLDAAGKATGRIVLPLEEAGASLYIRGIAFDPEGQLAVSAFEQVQGGASELVGGLYDAGNERQISAFAVPADRNTEKGMGFDRAGRLFIAAEHRGVGQEAEVLMYTGVNIAELQTRPPVCAPGSDRETDATVDCALKGIVNPYGVAETEAWFRWGGSCLSAAAETVAGTVPAVIGEEPVSATIEGLKPNAPVCYLLQGYDQNVKPPEAALTSFEPQSFTTPLVAPRIVGAPSASFVSSSSAELVSEVNPENASTEFTFEYASGGATLAEACPNGLRSESCAGVQSTSVARSGVYGLVGVTLALSDLQPATTYRYRLAAEDVNAAETQRDSAVGQEGTFTTAPNTMVQATTGSASAITATGATVSGAVDPDGQGAAYEFELGLYNGAATQYGVVYSGSAGAGAAPVEESLALSGLQPGTTYAYRIAIRSAYGTAIGRQAVFTTAGVPALLVAPTPLVQLPVPHLTFPGQNGKGKQNPAQSRRRARALARCAKKPKRRRAACRRAVLGR